MFLKQPLQVIQEAFRRIDKGKLKLVRLEMNETSFWNHKDYVM